MCCIKKGIWACCCKKKTKVGTASLIQNHANDESIQSGNFTDEMNHEMKLESHIEVNDNTHDNSHNRGQVEMPSIQKQTAKGNKQWQKQQMAAMYQNPFKNVKDEDDN